MLFFAQNLLNYWWGIAQFCLLVITPLSKTEKRVSSSVKRTII
jgi:hypothetical protein